MVQKIHYHKVPGLPVLQWVSDKHDRKSIAASLNMWEMSVRGLLSKPHIVVSDFSWAILHGVSEALNKRQLKEQIAVQWSLMTGTSEKCVILRLCANHYMHSICRRIKTLQIASTVSEMILFIDF